MPCSNKHKQEFLVYSTLPNNGTYQRNHFDILNNTTDVM